MSEVLEGIERNAKGKLVLKRKVAEPPKEPVESAATVLAPGATPLGRVISFVSDAFATTTRDITVKQVLEGIRTGGTTLKGQITQIRKQFEGELHLNGGDLQKAKHKIDPLKTALPGVMWSGQFSNREKPVAEKLLKHSGLLCADLDNLGPKLVRVCEQLKRSPHLFALFLSPSGNGLKPVFCVPVDASKHAASFRAVEKHVRELTGIQVDESARDVSRLCFMSFNPELYHNPNAIELEPLPEPEKPKAAFNSGLEVNLSERQRIASEMFGDIEWDSDTHGFLTCPGKHLHTTGERKQECEIHLDGAPNIHCFHGHCKGIEAGVNRELQSRIGKAEYKAPTENDTQPGESDNGEDATIACLAGLSLADYEKERAAATEKLGFRKSILDILVNAKRVLMHPPSEGDNLQGTAVKLVDVEPWLPPVDGAQVLDAIATRLKHYAVLPDGAADTLALWCAHTHAVKVFQKSPRLYISAPTEECGKSTLLNCTSLFCARAKRTDNMTTAVMFRLVAGQSPTILADECDKWLFSNLDLVGLIQSGAEKGGTVMRCEGDSNDLREFGCYAPFALAAIGKLPSQLHGRSICIRLSRATKEEINERSRFNLDHVEYETELNRKLCRWIADNRGHIASCDPKLPEHLFNRVADNWRPLFALAEIAGGNWPERCAAALSKLTIGDEEKENLRLMLLTDIQQIFTVERMFSKDLVDQLNERKERPWSEICHGKPMTQRWLARNLAAFGIHSKNIWDGEKEEQAKGYERSQFYGVFARYVPKIVGDPIPQASNRPIHREKPENPSVQKEIVWTDKKEPIHEAIGRLDGSTGGSSPILEQQGADQLPQTPEHSPSKPVEENPPRKGRI